jgi:hypothetical protein
VDASVNDGNVSMLEQVKRPNPWKKKKKKMMMMILFFFFSGNCVPTCMTTWN